IRGLIVTGVQTCALPIWSCVIAIVDEYAHLFRPGQRVLEIGCGAWSPLKEQGRAVGYQWEGIDVNSNYMGKPTIATRLASVESIDRKSVVEGQGGVRGGT